MSEKVLLNAMRPPRDCGGIRMSDKGNSKVLCVAQALISSQYLQVSADIRRYVQTSVCIFRYLPVSPGIYGDLPISADVSHR